MSTELLLLSDVEHLGKAGDVVKVADGYARNYLLPKDLAAPVSKQALRRLEKLRKEREEVARIQLAEAKEKASKLDNASVTLRAKTVDGTRLYGSIQAADIAAAGVDARGAFYAAVTLLQQMGVENGKPVLKCADINDWPEWQRPYAMEYGPATRQQLIDLAMYKVGHFAIQHRLEWREFRPDHMYGKRPLEEFLSEMAAFRDETGLFDYMLLLHIYASPSQDYELLDITNEDHIAEVIARCQYAASKGFTHIMILADDWTPRDKGRYVCMHESERKRFGDSVGRAHGYLMARLYDALKREYPALDFSICPAPYSLGHVYTGEGERKPHMVQYLRDLDAEMPPNIAVVWTGRFVGSPSIERAHFLEYSGLVGNRPTFLWDNSNCCDEAPSPQRFVTTRYDGFAADSHGIFYLNAFALHWPWQRPFVLSAMDALWNPEAFKVDGSFEQAVDKAYGPGVYPLVEAYRRTRAAMNGVQNDPQRLRTLVEEADAQLKAIEERGLPTKRLRDDWARQKALVDLKVAEGIVRRFTEPPVLDGKLDHLLALAERRADPLGVVGRLGETVLNQALAHPRYNQVVALADGAMSLGIRHLSLASAQTLPPLDDVYLLLGDPNMPSQRSYYGRDAAFTLRIEGTRTPPKAGETVQLLVTPEHMHWFDASSGQRV